MAELLKRTYWMDSDGRRCGKKAPGAVKRRARVWSIRMYIDGRRKLVKGYTDKGATEQLAARLEARKARGEMGLIDPFETHAKRPLTEHIGDYLADLRATNRNPAYIYNVEKRLAKLVSDCGWARLADVTADSFCRWRESPVESQSAISADRTIGARTLNQYLDALGTFCRWTIKRKRMAADPTAAVEKVDQTTDVRRKRRALTVEELKRLLGAVPDHYRLAYQIFMATGLRRTELLKLKWGDMKLNAPLPFIQLRAATTKAKRADVLPIRADLLDLLRAAKGKDDEPVVRALPDMDAHRTYLAKAGIPWMDNEGYQADIHALRHSYGTMLAAAGVNIREAMELMRHTDMRLTTKVYTDPRVFNLAGAVEKLPSLYARPADQQATGTDDRPIVGDSESEEKMRAHMRAHQGALIGQCSAFIGNPDQNNGRSVNPVTDSNWQQKTPSGMGGANNWGTRIRT